MQLGIPARNRPLSIRRGTYLLEGQRMGCIAQNGDIRGEVVLAQAIRQTKGLLCHRTRKQKPENPQPDSRDPGPCFAARNNASISKHIDTRITRTGKCCHNGPPRREDRLLWE
jgi:hypothetical protein